MSDQTIQATEEIVGSGHATKSDTINRHFLGGVIATLRDTDGKILIGIFKKQTSDPTTAADEIALYCKADGAGDLQFYKRNESNGTVELLGGKMKFVESGVETSGLTNGAFFAFLSTIDPDTHLLVLDGHDSGYAYNTGGGIVMKSDGTGFYHYCEPTGACPSASQRVAWTLYDVSNLIQDALEHFRQQVTFTGNGVWNDQTFAITTLTDYTQARIQINMRGKLVAGGGADYVNQIYGRATAAAVCTLSAYKFGASTYAPYICGIVVPKYSS